MWTSSGKYEETEMGSGSVCRLRNGGVERDLAMIEAACEAALPEATGVDGGSALRRDRFEASDEPVSSLINSCRRKMSSTVLEGGLGVANWASFGVEGEGSIDRMGVRGASGDVARLLAWRRSISSTVEDIGRVGDCSGAASPSCCSSPRPSHFPRTLSTLALTRCEGVHLRAGEGPVDGGANMPLFWDPARLSDEPSSRRA